MWMAMNGPAPGFCRGAGLQVRSLSGPHWRACRILRICGSLFSWLPLRKLAPKASAVARNTAGSMSSEVVRSEEHTSELQSRENLVCRLLLEKKNDKVDVDQFTSEAC